MSDAESLKEFKKSMKGVEKLEQEEHKVRCSCGSLVLQKNLAVHIKTAKHQKLTSDPQKKAEFETLQKEKKSSKKVPKGDEDVEEDEEEEGDDIDEILDRLDTLEEMVKEGFTQVITMLMSMNVDEDDEVDTPKTKGKKDSKDETE